ncbi:hypothetical protein [Streptomyces sp. NBC_00386]|uniref:hypothetical protein n=1 Tax=Streptomyces sp. NBC_00386 TaxID=2975734 RepID=UPI002E1CFA87
MAEGEAVGLAVGLASANTGAVKERVNNVAEAINKDRWMVFFEAGTIEKVQGL